MRKQVLFVHSGGAQGWKQGSSYLLTYLKTMLGDDYQVLSPEMPEPEHPEYCLWKTELDRNFALLKDDAIIVGHSLGGSVLLKYLSEQTCEKHIMGLFIVAAPYWGLSQWEVEEYRLTDNFQDHLPPIDRLALYHSHNDEVVPYNHMHVYANKLPWATIRETQGYHLFHQGLPELVADIMALATGADSKPFRSSLNVQASPTITTLSPYLHFAGQCREAMVFYQDCLGGELTFQPVKGSPLEKQCPAAVQHRILHASLIKGSLALFATDMSGPEGVHPGNSVSLSLNCSSEAEIDIYFSKLAAGARITEGLKQQTWGARFGALVDKYGVGWMLHYAKLQHP